MEEYAVIGCFNQSDLDVISDIFYKDNICFKVSEKSFDNAAFSIYELNNDIQYEISILNSDFMKADELLNGFLENKLNHNSNALTDDEVISIILFSEDWSEEEVSMAHKLANERKLDVDLYKKQYFETQKAAEENEKEKHFVIKSQKTSGWFLLIVVISLFDAFMYARNLSLNLPFGLELSQLNLYLSDFNLTKQSKENYLLISYSLIGMYFLIYIFAKKDRLLAFVVGFILYLFDTVLCVLAKDWFEVVSHLFALMFIYYGINRIFVLRNDAPSNPKP